MEKRRKTREGGSAPSGAPVDDPGERSPRWRRAPPSSCATAHPVTTPRCGRASPRQSPRPADLNVVVVTLDTTRADRLGCYGFSGVADAEHRRARPRRAWCSTSDRGGAAHVPVARVDVHRPRPAAPRRARQRRLLPGRRESDAGRTAAGARATRRARSSARGCSSRAGGWPRASTTTRTASSSASTRSSRSAPSRSRATR